jgi:hypothetical protein
VSHTYDDLVTHRKNDPAWRLLTADHAPLIIAFLDRAFREPNHRYLSEPELALALEDFLFELRRLEGDDAFPRSAPEYLTEWAQNDKGWLRKFYPPGDDEAHYDLTPGTERALAWVDTLFERGFVGTESRLYTVIRLLEEIVHGVEEDDEARIRRLEAQKRHIDAEIAAIRTGDVPILDDRSLRERFTQFSRIARELLSDFRSVEHNFRELDRRVREEIAGWTENKATLLESVFGRHDMIADSDEGQSFRAFWDFLMSPESQEELSTLLDHAFSIESLGDLRDDRRLRRIHYDWMSAGEQTQRTVARLSQQLRRFLDDQTYLENRRIIEILNRIGRHGLALRDTMPKGTVMEIDAIGADITLPLERPLYSGPGDDSIVVRIDDEETPDVDLTALFNSVTVDTERLRRQIRSVLFETGQVTLAAVLARYPLEEGLAELVGYFSIAAGDAFSVIDDEREETVFWTDRTGTHRRARVPVVLFQREATDG